MPVVRAIYRSLKQVFETLFSGNGSSFRRVGLVEFPSPGMWSIVLISQAPSAEIANKLASQEEHISVFLPCAPNPTTGFFFYVPKSKIIEVEMSTEDAATLIMSCGVVQPGSDQQKKIAALAGMANAARVAPTAALQTQPATFPYLLGWVLQVHIPYAHAAIVALMTLVVCLGAAVIPARSAARLEPATALRHE